MSVEGNTDRMEVELRWAGGFVSRHTLLRPMQTYEQLSNFDELVARIDALRTEGHLLREIASMLNAEGFRPPKRSQKFTVGILSGFLRERGIRTGPQPRSVTHEDHLLSNEWWLRDLAAHLQMPIATMHRWQRVGWVTSRKVKAAGNRWAIFADTEELARMARLRNPPRNWPNPNSLELITPKPAPSATPGTTST